MQKPRHFALKKMSSICLFYDSYTVHNAFFFLLQTMFAYYLQLTENSICKIKSEN